MKILYFTGGLGNQMFEYAFYLYLKNRFPGERFYGLYNKHKLGEHYGLEIDRWFDVQLPPSKWHADALAYLLFVVRRVFKIHRYYDGGMYEIERDGALIHYAFKYSNKFFVDDLASRFRFKIDERMLSQENKHYLSLIRSTDSVYIHVRRGDYLSPKYLKDYEGTCPLSYYDQAIKDIKAKIAAPHFFVFSDDMEWASANLPLGDSKVTYVTGNTAENSPIDMFLMSCCKNAIMANSTFSYWAAILGNHKENVYYPKKWVNNPAGQPDIFFDNWISF